MVATSRLCVDGSKFIARLVCNNALTGISILTATKGDFYGTVNSELCSEPTPPMVRTMKFSAVLRIRNLLYTFGEVGVSFVRSMVKPLKDLSPAAIADVTPIRMRHNASRVRIFLIVNFLS